MRNVPKHAGMVAKKLGVPFVSDKDLPLWTGRAINLAHVFNDPIYTPSNVIFHELAHYVLAPKKYRHQPNFGWYDTPAGPRVRENEGATPDRMNEERKAQALGYLAMRHYKLDWERACEDDGWEPEGVLTFGNNIVADGLVEGLSLRPYFIDGVIPS